jgi:hypothetical protein
MRTSQRRWSAGAPRSGTQSRGDQTISVSYGRTPTRFAEWYRRRQDLDGSVITSPAPGELVVCPCPGCARQACSTANPGRLPSTTPARRLWCGVASPCVLESGDAVPTPQFEAGALNSRRSAELCATTGATVGGYICGVSYLPTLERGAMDTREVVVQTEILVQGGDLLGPGPSQRAA